MRGRVAASARDLCGFTVGFPGIASRDGLCLRHNAGMKRLLTVVLLAGLFGCPSCATAVGTIAGPVTGPLHLEENTEVAPWFKPFAYVISVPVGVFAGFIAGATADWGFVTSGFHYGADGHPPFDVVFNPMAPDWGRPPLKTTDPAPKTDG